MPMRQWVPIELVFKRCWCKCQNVDHALYVSSRHYVGMRTVAAKVHHKQPTPSDSPPLGRTQKCIPVNCIL